MLSGKVNILIAMSVAISTTFGASSVLAEHSWLGFHWTRTNNPFSIILGDNMSKSWDSTLKLASADWSASSVLNTVVVPGKNNVKNCNPILGRVEVCNGKYGKIGWLGIASAWVDGSHITQGTVKMNDTYFNTAPYNTPEWKRSVLCQEIGHVLGLDHQDEDFGNANLDTCMDYSMLPSSNQSPNSHDYEMLETMYEHLDSTTSIALKAQTFKGNEVDHSDKSTWGKPIKSSKNNKTSVFLKETSEGKVFTFVIWSDEEVQNQ